MKVFLQKIGIFLLVACTWMACNGDSYSAGSGVLDDDDAIVVYVDTFPLVSMTDSCKKAIVSQADSFLLGEIETDYGLIRGSILTQLACPEGYSYPKNAEVDSICLFIYYNSCVGDAKAPLAIDAYQMDKGTFNYSTAYLTDLNTEDYCTETMPILTNHRIVVASEKLDSVQNSDGKYVPMLRMRVNEDFQNRFWAIQSFEDQKTFNNQFNGILLKSSFGSSTMLNISNIALAVYYKFKYNKAGRDTTVTDVKAFYANAEVRTINQISYQDKKETIESLQKDSDTYNYIISPACAYTHVVFPMERIYDSIMRHMIDPLGGDTVKRPYVNKAEVRFNVKNVYGGSESNKQRNDWLQPASYMLLVKEASAERFFANKEIPSDTCALLSPLVQSTDASGNAIYYYTYDLSDFLTNQLRQKTNDKELRMILVPVTVNATTSTTVSTYSSVREQATMSATQIQSAKNGTQFEIVYSGFSIPVEVE